MIGERDGRSKSSTGDQEIGVNYVSTKATVNESLCGQRSSEDGNILMARCQALGFRKRWELEINPVTVKDDLCGIV